MGFICWLFQIFAAIILLQTLYYKFTASPESIYIFENLGIEPWGRYTSGVIELFAGLFLLVPRLNWLGALLGVWVMTAALYVHLWVLEIVIMGDGGAMFYLACSVWVCCLAVLWIRRGEMIEVLNRWSTE